MYEIIRTKNARKATYAYEFVDMFDILMPNLPEEIMAILGKERTLARLQRVIDSL